MPDELEDMGPHQALRGLEAQLEADGGKRLIQPGCAIVLAGVGQFNLAESYDIVQAKRRNHVGSDPLELTCLAAVGPRMEWNTPVPIEVEPQAIIMVMKCTDALWANTVAEMKANQQGHSLAMGGMLPGMRAPGQ